MRVRLFIYSALTVVGILWIFAIRSDRFAHWLDWKRERANSPLQTAVTRFGVEGKTWEKRRETPWSDSKVVLYRSNGEVTELNAKKAIYREWSSTHATNQGTVMSVIAFVDPITQEAWVGAVNSGERDTNEFDEDSETQIFYLANTNFFIETGSGIFEGDTEIDDGSFSWLGSPIHNASTLDVLIREWEQKHDGSWPFWSEVWTSRFIEEFPKDCFSSGNMGSQSIPVQRIEIAHGKLRLFFYSFKYRKDGSVLLDLKTLRFRRAVF